ncbi:LOW QUALITY PROTEIN: glutamic acid-rich protein-like [Panonychus citri]|uniref:LOW QUALITY PROTEIN: glutamic acid-rich protein-like n=1 Tax=Panonychus citri TaxID=50023 RepID=UPI00230779FC|nr:LOW QUALITY PROTEIN: glutamic acid-rich protein-like [Panonychus citri]
MSMMEDRSGLFNEIQKFSQRALRKVETNVTTGLGEKVVEKRNAKGLKTLDNESNKSSKSNDTQSKLDLQVGLVIPGLMIGSQDVAHNKKVLEEYGITHIINAAENEVENRFEDDYNYYSMQIEDSSSTDLNKYLDDIYEFIDQGRFAGNCFVHCDAHKPGLSRSSAICIAYLMYKEKRRFDDAYNEVKEARPFVKPNDSFMKQLKKLDEEYNGTKKKDEIEDPFTKKKRMEIEAEKAMLKGTTSVKNKLQMFKKVEEDEKIRVTSPTPNKLRTNGVSWGTETGEDNNNNSNKDNSSEEKPTPKKLTSILSFFQPKDASSSSFKANNSIGLPKVAPSNGPVKKWKPVETKGLQRVKDPQIKFDPHKDFSAYERIKKSKSGVKWATKKDALKRTKSKEFKAAMAAKENQPTLPPSTPASKTTQSPEIKNNSTIKSDSKSTTTTSKATPNVSAFKSPSNSVPPPPPPPPPVPMESSSSSPSTKSTSLQSKTSKPRRVVTSQVKSARPTLRKRPSQEDESSKQTTESQRPPLRRRPSQEVNEENVTSPSATNSRQLRRRPSQETNDQTADVQLRPSLRRRPSQENQIESESTIKPVTPTTSAPTEPVYPWRKGRKSSEVNQETINNKSSVTNSNTTSINNQQSKSSEQESMRKQSVTFDETPTQSKPEDKPKVYGVCRPKPKNIVGGAIWTAEEKPTPKKPEEIKTEDENKKIHSNVGTSTSTPTPTQTPSKSNPLTPQPVEVKINSPSKQQVNQDSTKIEKKKEEDKKDVKKIIIMQQEESDEDEDEEEEDEEDEEETEEDSDEEEEDEDDEDEDDEDEDETVQSKKSGLTRSSTAEILKLIKSKTKAEIAHSMDIIEEDEEIDVLLNELEKEGIENIDWGELGIGLNEVKDIVENAIEEEEEDAEEEDDEEGNEEEEEDEDESNNEKEKDEEEEEIENLLKNLEKEGIKEDLSDFSESGKESPISSVTIVSTARPTTPSSSLKVPSMTKSSNQVKKPEPTVNYIQKAPVIDDEEEEEEEDSCEEEVELVIEDDSD